MRRTMLLLFVCIATMAQAQDLPEIDGFIREGEWSDATVFSDFHLISPRSTEKYYDSTIVYIKQSSDALFFAIRFWPKGRVISQSFVRDRSSDEENEFFILLDLENKRQNGYFFAFNFLGNQRDMRMYNQRQMSQEWDWNWQNKSTIFEDATPDKPGYIETEVRIPVDKLQNKSPNTIGIDVQLFAYKQDGTSYFYSISPESELLSLKGPYQMHISPFVERANINMSAIPYAVGYTFTDSSYEARVGGEFSVSIDRHTLKGTYNTDASTLEADPFVFSFYKRKVSLAEKRPFFSRDLDVYRSPISLLYTRGIADINYGANYTFRSNTLKAGAFYVEEEPIPGDTAHNIRRFMAVRPNVVTKFVNFGGTFIHNEQTDGPSETIISGDARVDLPSRWVFVPQLATNKDGYASKAYLYYEFNPAGGPYADFSYTRFGKKFDGMTVINLFGKNYDEISNSVGYNFIYNRSYFHQMNARVEFYKAESLDRDFMLQRNINGNFFYKVNDWLSVNHYAEISNADEALSDTTKKNHDDYAQDHNVKILIGNNAIVLGYKEGSYYGQKLRNPYASYESMFFSRVGVSATAFLVENEARIFSAKINYRIMPKLFLRSLYQWKSEKGNSDKYDNFQLWNSMLQYEFFAGSNLYLVLNLQGEDLEYVGRYCKLAYEFNF